MTRTADWNRQIRGKAILAALVGMLTLCRGAFAQPPGDAPTDSAGTLSVWIRPRLGDNHNISRSVAHFNWTASLEPEFVLSQDRARSPRFFVRLDNRRALVCSPRFSFPYAFLLPDMATQIVVTWESGSPGVSRWFVDGKIFCEAGADFSASQAAIAIDKSQSYDVSVERATRVDRAWSAEEVHRAYRQGGGDARAKWSIALASVSADEPGTAIDPHERRVMQDEDSHWSDSRSEIIRRLQRLQEAGFNVYMPLVWNGARMFCLSGVAPVSPGIRDPLDPRYDPLTFLIREAHKRGIEVHPWIYVVGRQPGEGFPASFTDGSPIGAFNLHHREFRDFIVELAVDIAKLHDIDGLNLDYVRAVGPCTDAACIGSYRQRYGRSLAEDWKTALQHTFVPSLAEFNSSAVTDIVMRTATGVRTFRPHAVLTVDSVLFDFDRAHQGLDEQKWLRQGFIDAVMNMSYDDPIDIDGLDRANVAVSADHLVITVRNYDIFGADVVDRSGVVMSDYVRLIRKRWPGSGIGVYHYMHMDANQLAGFRSVFQPAAVPGWEH